MKEADPLKGYATELENFIGKVDSESVDLAELPPVITTIKNTIQKLRQVAEQLDIFHEKLV